MIIIITTAVFCGLVYLPLFFPGVCRSGIWVGVYVFTHTHTVDITAAVSDLFWGQIVLIWLGHHEMSSGIWHCWSPPLKRHIWRHISRTVCQGRKENVASGIVNLHRTAWIVSVSAETDLPPFIYFCRDHLNFLETHLITFCSVTVLWTDLILSLISQ